MTKDNEVLSETDSLEPIRQSIRSLCSQDQFTWEQSWKSVLSDVNQARRGLLLPDVFQQTLELNEIRLTKKALQAIIQQFQLPNGAVQAHKFLQWINLSKPNDHVDPELTFARLPQPYRRIVKILERDILDGAWETIQATSAKYKAETSAALSARSARSSVLLTHSPDEATSLQDDYALAKKRCCKTFQEVTSPTGAESVVMIKVHSHELFAVLVWTQAPTKDTPRLTMQLLHTQSLKSITLIPIEPPSASSAVPTDSTRNLRLINATELRSRSMACGDATTRLVLAVYMREEITTADTTMSIDHVLLYEFLESLTEFRASLLASVTMSDPSEAVRAIALSTDTSLLAIATSKCETTVYSVPLPTPSGVSSSESPMAPPSTLTTITKLISDAPATSVFFLNPPIVDTPTRPAPSSVVLQPYAVALVASKTLMKYQLPPLTNNTTVVPATLLAKWPHLTTIISSSIDATTQYVTIGLMDGLIVVWDVLTDRDFVMLTPPPISPPTHNDAVDVAFLCGDQFVVSLSLSTQRLFFYDLENRAAPTLIRVVTPPPPSTSAASTAVEPIRLVSLSSYSPLLDIPVAMVEYSNGYVQLYDVRNGEAMASLRVAKRTRPDGGVCVAPSNHAVVALTPDPVVFEWKDLLITAFPSLLSVLQGKRLQPTTENLKRVYIASVDTSSSSLFLDGATLTVGGKASLQSMLQASAGPNRRSTTALPNMTELLSGSKSTSSLSQPASNTDSRTSLVTTSSGMSSAPQQEPEPLPELLTCASYPYKPSFDTLFERFYDEEIANTTSSGDTKLSRRRNELLKILTAAW